ncbi:DMT family transporter [Jeongeupia naejangsanensis]|uniref:DMT family transporter n=1 Tax=Jeongeupia naejangsanensis TaxID=613195 RepID=A0ABS2BM41_9NEIS|nr:DMT family transporter [Jeongeupia naejangsanensis]MBM3115849.1 DMT family transporter [Jeongeupia naejangsanensis]
MRTTYLKLALTAFFWGAVFHLAKYAVGHLSPLAIASWRFLSAGVLLVPLVYWREGLDWAGLRRNALPLLAMAAVGICGFNIALFYGLHWTSPVNGALIIALSPALTVMLSALLNRDAVSARQLGGLALGLAGVATVVSHGSLAALLALLFTPGDVLVFGGALAMAIYSTIPRRFVRGLAPLQVSAATVGLGGLLMGAIAQFASPDFYTVPPAGVVAAIAVMSVFGSVLAYMWWNDGVAKLGAARTAMFMNLVPIFAALIGVALGQPLSGAQLAGAVLVIGGVALASGRPAAPVPRPAH